MLRPRPKV